MIEQLESRWGRNFSRLLTENAQQEENVQKAIAQNSIEVLWSHQAMRDDVSQVDSTGVTEKNPEIERDVVAQKLLNYRLRFEDVIQTLLNHHTRIGTPMFVSRFP